MIDEVVDASNGKSTYAKLRFVRFDPILDVAELKKEIPISSLDLMGIPELRISGCFDRS